MGWEKYHSPLTTGVGWEGEGLAFMRKHRYIQNEAPLLQR